MSKKTKDLPLRVIRPPLDVALEELKRQEESTIGKKPTVVLEPDEKDKKPTVSEKPTVGIKTTVGEKTTVTFVPYEEIFAEDDPNYWFKYVVIFHWLMDNLFPEMKSSASRLYSRFIRLAYGIKSNKGVCKVGYKSLERSSGVTKKHLRSAIKEFQKMGALKVVGTENKGKHGGGSTYKIFVPKEAIATVSKKLTVGKKTTVVQNDPFILDDINNIFDHHLSTVKKLYSEVAGNQWNKNDDDSYMKVKDIELEIIEKAIKIAAKRAKNRPNSFEFFIKQIQIFADPPAEERKRLKKALGELVNVTRQIRVGGSQEINLDKDVKRRCEWDGVFFDEAMYQEILDESRHGRWEPNN